MTRHETPFDEGGGAAELNRSTGTSRLEAGPPSKTNKDNTGLTLMILQVGGLIGGLRASLVVKEKGELVSS